MSEQPLRGLTVVDLSRLVPGPFCTHVLAQLGAEIIKVEDPRGGDPLRLIGGERTFGSINRGKHSIALDLKEPAARERVLELAAGADVFVESFRPGTASRLGLGPADVKVANPGIIYCSISGYGQTGPSSRLPGHDINYLGWAGLAALSGDADGPPAVPFGVSIADLCSSMYAAVAILAALRERVLNGRGAVLDVSMTETVVGWMATRLAAWSPGVSKEELVGRGGYGIYATSDRRWVSIAAVEEHFWTRLCSATGRPDLAEDPRYRTFHERNANRAALDQELAALFITRTREDWCAFFAEHDLPGGPVNEIADLAADPQLLSRAVFDERGDPGFPALFDGTRPRAGGNVPVLGSYSVGHGS